MKNIEELNQVFYSLYGELSENEEFLTRKQSEVMSSFLLKQYIIEYQKLALAKEIEDKDEIFVLKNKSKHYIPKRIIFFYNKLAKLIVKEIKKEANEYYAKLRNNNGQSKPK